MKLVFATNNLDKLAELKDLVPDGIEILSLRDINCNKKLPETNPTLEGNALQKAKYIFDNYGFNCFSDDTGLEIDVLAGAPGVYSARYAGEDCSSEDNINKVLGKLLNYTNRAAIFRTVITLILNGKEYIFQGDCQGEISQNKSGVEGFGYDPIFTPNGYDITFAEMTMQEKSAISHRGKAVDQLISFLNVSNIL